MSCAQQTEWASGNIFIRPINFRTKGTKVGGHTHTFDHTTIVFQGSIHVKATSPDGRVVDEIFSAPSHLLIKADWIHELTALEDGTICWCVYSHRDPQGQVIQNPGWTGAYG